MANRFNWSLGHEGKGNVYPNEDISTWNVDEISSPHHEEEAAQENQDYPVFKFYISPEGGIHDGGLGFENFTAYPDDQVIERITSEGNTLYDARSEGLEDPQAEPRVEQPGGGYGHAYNLLEMMSKIGVAKEEGWADFHTELKLPRSIRRKIREWVNRLDWPEGSEQEDARRYHITILSMDEYDDDFADWAREQIRGKVFSFETTGMEIFGDEHVVLRVDCPEWTTLVKNWQEKAEREGLEPHTFDSPKAHITVGKSPEGKWPQGIPDPHLEFDTRMFNINKNAAANADYWDKEVGYPHNEFTEMVPTEAMLPYREFDRPVKDDLRDHIAQHGMVGSIKLEYNPETERAHVGEGNHRLRAAQELGLSHVPVEVLRTSREPYGAKYPGKPTEGSENFRGAPVPTPYQPDQHGYIPGNMKPSDLGLPTQGVEKEASEHETTPADELAKWLQSFPAQQESQPLSIHHTDESQISPQTRSPVVSEPHIDPPSHPYEPYNWAEEGFETSPLDRTQTEVTASLDICPQCESPDGTPCEHCGYDELKNDSEYEKAKHHWYDTAWDEPGSPRPFPSQPEHWRHDHAPNVKMATIERERLKLNELDNPAERRNSAERLRANGSTDDLHSLRPREPDRGGCDPASDDGDRLRRLRGDLSGPSASIGHGWREI